MKIGVIGSINIDFVYATDRTAKKGETVFGNTYDILNGGKGANQAVLASAITNDVIFLGAVGNDRFSEMAIDHLSQRIPNCNDIVCKDTTTGMAVIELSEGDNRITVIPGANLYLDNQDVLEFLNRHTDLETIILQYEIDVSVVEFIIKECVKRNIRVVLNPAPVQELKKDVIELVKFLIPNETEFEEIFGHCNYEQEVIKHKGSLIVTMGSKGVMYLNRNVPEIYPANKIIAKDTTGAGDSFVAGFSVGISKGLGIKQAVGLGVNIASVTCECFGAQGGYERVKDEYNEEKWNIK